MSDVEQEDGEEKQEQLTEQERSAAAKKRRDQDKQRLKKERQAVEKEARVKLEAIAAAAAAEAAAVAAVEQAKIDKKAAAAAEIEAQRLANLAKKKNKKSKMEDLDDLAVLESAAAANDNVSDDKATTAQHFGAANKSLLEAERAEKLRDALKTKKAQVAKSKKVAKAPDAAAPSEEERAHAARIATAADVTRNRNMEREREAHLRRVQEKAAAAYEKQSQINKAKPQPITTSPVDKPVPKTAPSPPDAAQMLRDLELEIGSIEAAVLDMSRAVVLDRVTELMIKLDDVPVASTELRACRKNAIARLDAMAASMAP